MALLWKVSLTVMLAGTPVLDGLQVTRVGGPHIGVTADSKGDQQPCQGLAPGVWLLPQKCLEPQRAQESTEGERLRGREPTAGSRGPRGQKRQVGQPQQAGHISVGALGCSHHQDEAFKVQGRPGLAVSL